MNDTDMAIETFAKSTLGFVGAFTSWNLAHVNQVASLIVAVLTAVYLIVQIHKATKK